MADAPIRPLTDLLSMVRPLVNGCPIPFALQALRIAAIRYCERTSCWRHIASYDVTDQGGAVVCPYYAAIHRFETADMDHWPLTPVQYSHIEPSDRDAEASDNAVPRYITQISPGTVNVYPFRTGRLTVSLFLKPRIGNEWCPTLEGPFDDAFDVIPEFLVQQHGHIIADGALEVLMLTPNQPFTNYDLGMRHAAKFEKAMDATDSTSIRGQQRARLRAKPQWF